jgi:hypothetical protein
MKSFTEWLNEAQIHKDTWGYEISGTVEEVIKVLQQVPPNRTHLKCIASVSVWPKEQKPIG